MNDTPSDSMDRRRFLGLAATAGVASMAGGLLLTGCSSGEACPQQTAEPEPADQGAPAAGTPASAPAGTKTLVSVFSRSGNTPQVAERIYQQVDSDFFRIEPAEPYGESYDEMLEVAQREQDGDIRPNLAAAVQNWDEYGTVYLGYPVWWGHVPPVIKSFVEAHDLAGKRVIPFATSGGTDISATLADILELCHDVQFSEGLTLDGNSVATHLDRVDAWLGNIARR